MKEELLNSIPISIFTLSNKKQVMTNEQIVEQVEEVVGHLLDLKTLLRRLDKKTLQLLQEQGYNVDGVIENIDQDIFVIEGVYEELEEG